MKNSLEYFYKTQLSVILLFNFLLFMAYFPFVIFSLIYFFMYEKTEEPLFYSYLTASVPIFLFFIFGLYYRNARHFYLSFVTPRYFLYTSGKTYKSKTPIQKPDKAFFRHFPAFFPLIYTLAATYLFQKARFFPLYKLVNLPYNWIWATPFWNFVYGNSKISSFNFISGLTSIGRFKYMGGFMFTSSFMFPMILSCLTYTAFSLGYILGGIRPIKNLFDRLRSPKPKKAGEG